MVYLLWEHHIILWCSFVCLLRVYSGILKFDIFFWGGVSHSLPCYSPVWVSVEIFFFSLQGYGLLLITTLNHCNILYVSLFTVTILQDCIGMSTGILEILLCYSIFSFMFFIIRVYPCERLPLLFYSLIHLLVLIVLINLLYTSMYIYITSL